MEQDFRHLLYIGLCCVLAAVLLVNLGYVLDSNKEVARFIEEEDRLQNVVVEYKKYPYKFVNDGCTPFDAVEYILLNWDGVPVYLNSPSTAVNPVTALISTEPGDESFMEDLYGLINYNKWYDCEILENESGFVTGIYFY